MLAASCGTTISLAARGEDAAQALAALVILVETGFGEHNLPFLNSLDDKDRERAFRDFAVYALFVSLAHERGIFTLGADSNGLIPVPILDELTSIFWAGPRMGSGVKKNASKKEAVFGVRHLPPFQLSH